MLTTKDLNKIEAILDKKFGEKFGIFLTKDEFYAKVNELMSEIKLVRKEMNRLFTPYEVRPRNRAS